MFTNIGAKIKGLAKAGCWVGIVGCIFAGVVLLFTEEEFIPIALGVAVGGSLASWIGSWFLYGFGQLIENSDVIAGRYKKDNDGKDDRQKEQEKAPRKKQNQKQKQEHHPKEKLQSKKDDDGADNDGVSIRCPRCSSWIFISKNDEQLPSIDCPHCYETILMKDLLG